MLAIGFPGWRNPPTICTNGWIMNCKPVIAYNEPKNRMEIVASKQDMRKPHL